MELLLQVSLDIDPPTFGDHDSEKRQNIRKEIKKQIPDFDESKVNHFVRLCTDIEVELDCYLKEPYGKDVDNLAKIPIDAIFFSASNESGYKTWESKIMSLSVRKRKCSQNKLGIMVRGK